MAKFAKTLEELKLIGEEYEISRDALLWRQGDSGDEVVVLLEGLFDVVREGPEGDPVVIRTVDAGAILGEMSAMDGHARSAAVRASTQCRVLRVPGEEFRTLIRSRPDLLEELFWQQVAWVRSLTEEVARTHKPPILDRLTRVYTERFFRERLRAELERARETGDLLSIVLAEADDFDIYREAEGARTADETVAKLAQIVHGAARKGDLISRMADVRFAVLLYGATEGDAERLAERVRERTQATSFKGASALPGGHLSVSLGTATCPMDGARADSLFDAAELSLHRDRLDRERAGPEGPTSMLDWFAGAREDSIDELVRRKRYGKAVKLLRTELEKRKGDRRLRLRLGEILVLAGERPEGVRLLSKVADDMALHGQVAQAIAVLKKIEAIEPGREDVEEKLAYLVERRANPSFDPWKRPARSADDASADDGAAELEIGFEPSLRTEEPAAAAEGGEPSEPPDPGELSGPIAADDVSEDTLRNEILALIEDTLNPVETEVPAGTGAAPSEPKSFVETPLFRSLSREELVALIKGLRLLSFEPGQIIVAEGELGASLFVLTTGLVRAYVRNTAGQQVQVRRLKEGDFFGEISVLSGAPRTATITAASRCELLELDKATLDAIAETHPHVREVLQQFHDQRKDNTLETLSRAARLPGR